MNEINHRLAASLANRTLLKPEPSRQNGERFLQFSLQSGVNGSIPLAKLLGTTKIALQDILPIPQVAEFWLGIVNWQGEATWIVDLARLLGGSHWCRRQPVTNSGMAILIGVDPYYTVGLLVERVNGIATYEPQSCLPIANVNATPEWRSLFEGYFLSERGELSMLLNLPKLITVLQS